ncbi:MAG: hypothetical protein EXR05_03095 [Acetobacteraceae bacterium]|nr:hypothetical protein [Acetobacteraceae bacterium]
MAGASWITGKGSLAQLPCRVGRLATSTRPLTVLGTPAGDPKGHPATQRVALFPATTMACVFIAMNAFNPGLSRAIRSVTACKASTGGNARVA